MALYRVRWQVELAIKRWKSLLDVDALAGAGGEPARRGLAQWEAPTMLCW